MNNQDFRPPETPPQAEDRQRRSIELECVGSFTAFTQDKEPHTVEIWTKFCPIHDRGRRRVAPGVMVLTTTEGRDVEYVARGQYRLHENPEVSLSSDDPEAP